MRWPLGLHRVAHLGICTKLLRRGLSTEAGLFGLPLRNPKDWRHLVASTKDACEALVTDVLSARSGLEAIRRTDELSDTICKTVDAAEVCRNVHADSVWRAEAQNACITLGGFLAHLNVHQGLYYAILSAVDSAEAVAAPEAGQPHSQSPTEAPLPAAALRVGQLLLRDFEMQGVHLQDAEQERFLEASAQEQMLCMQYGQNLGDMSKYASLSLPVTQKDQLSKLSANMQGQIRRQGSTLRIPTHEQLLGELLTRLPSSKLRRQAYQVGNSSPRDNIQVIERLMGVRQEIAQLLGAPSYSHYQASRDTFAEHPAAVDAFLTELSVAASAKAAQEIVELRHLKPGGTTPQAWDELYLRSQAQASWHSSALCTLPECLQILSGLCRSLFDVTLQPVTLAPGETWADDVQKLALIDGTSGLLGHLYLDLYTRPGKVQGQGVQYSIVNGRRLPDGTYQRPLAALVCNFPHDGAARLSVHSVETLFHEWGHVLNALLNRTDFQHVAGTRGTSDCVELASQLFEYFATDERVFESIPGAAAAIQLHKSHERAFAGLDLQRQIFYARLDQELHSEPLAAGGSLALVERIAKETLSFPAVPGIAPQARFAHLAISPGSKYYSYLYSKAFAATVWKRHLADDPHDAAAGRHIRTNLLETGLSLEPQRMVGQLVGSDAIHTSNPGFRPRTHELLAEIGAMST